MKLRHPNRPNGFKAVNHAIKKHRCFCKPNKTGGDHQLKEKERALRRVME